MIAYYICNRPVVAQVQNSTQIKGMYISVNAVNCGGVENLPVFTQCGVSKPDGPLEFNEEGNAFERYLAAAAKTMETGSWSEQLTLEADMSIAYESGKTKTKVTLTVDSDVSNYVEDDLSQIEITSLANMKVMGQTYAWSTEYYDGVAHYEYTEPFQRSESLEIPPDFFDFETSIPEAAILTEEVSGNQIRFIVSGEEMTETGIAAVQQMIGVNNLECEDVEVIATLNNSGGIQQIVMNFDASVNYQGYNADVTYMVQYVFSDIAIFSELPPRFVFSSGAGGWGTTLYMNEDGAFTGTYRAQSIDTGDGYPNGTIYISNFSGRFVEPVKVDEYAYSMKLREFTTEGEMDSVSYADGIRYIITEPYGFESADEFMLYCPGADITSLPEGFTVWLNAFMNIGSTATLPVYGIYNVSGEAGFIEYEESSNRV